MEDLVDVAKNIEPGFDRGKAYDKEFLGKNDDKGLPQKMLAKPIPKKSVEKAKPVAAKKLISSKGDAPGITIGVAQSNDGG